MLHVGGPERETMGPGMTIGKGLRLVSCRGAGVRTALVRNRDRHGFPKRQPAGPASNVRISACKDGSPQATTEPPSSQRPPLHVVIVPPASPTMGISACP